MDISVTCKGLAEIERKLKLLPERIGRRARMRKGANVIPGRGAAKADCDPKPASDFLHRRAVVAEGVSGRRRVMRVVRGGG